MADINEVAEKKLKSRVRKIKNVLKVMKKKKNSLVN